MVVSISRAGIAVTMLSGVMLLAGCSCTGNDHLIFATATKVGVDVTAVKGTPVNATVGYRRFEGAVLPVDSGSNKIADIAAKIDLQNSFSDGLTIDQEFRTGSWAREVGKK